MRGKGSLQGKDRRNKADFTQKSKCRHHLYWHLSNFIIIFLKADPLKHLCQKTSHQNSLSQRRIFLLGAGVNLGDIGKEIQHTAGVTPLVVVPGDQLDEVSVERDTSLGIEDGGVVVADQISGDELILGVSQYAWTLLAYIEKGKESTYP